MRSAKGLIGMLLAMTLAGGLSGCQKEEGPAEQAGKKVDEAIEKMGERIEEAGDKVRDATER